MSWKRRIPYLLTLVVLVGDYAFFFWNWPGHDALRTQAYALTETPTAIRSPAFSLIFRLLLLFVAAVASFFIFKHRRRLPFDTLYPAFIGLGLLPFIAEGIRSELLFIVLAYCPLVLPWGESKSVNRSLLFCLSTLMCLLLVLYSAWRGMAFEFVGTGGLIRLSGGFGSPLIVAPIALAGFIGGVHLLLRSTTRLSYVVGAILSIVAGFCLVAAATRAASLAALAGALVAFFKFRTPMTALFTAAAISLAALLFVERYQMNAIAYPGTFDASASARLHYQTEAARLMLRHPLGLGRFAFDRYLIKPSPVGAPPPILDAKGYYINYGLEFGMGWMAFLVARDLWLCFFVWQKGGYELIFVNVASVVYKLVACPFDFNVYVLPASFAFAALIGALICDQKTTSTLREVQYG